MTDIGPSQKLTLSMLCSGELKSIVSFSYIVLMASAGNRFMCVIDEFEAF